MEALILGEFNIVHGRHDMAGGTFPTLLLTELTTGNKYEYGML